MHEVEPRGAEQVEADVTDENSLLYKDAVLDRLSERANVAQFVSFAPDLAQRHARVRGYEANHLFPSVEEAARSLLAAAPDKSVNVRSFAPGDFKGKPFAYGLTSAPDAVSKLKEFSDAGLHTILNETVDVADGGVSGVAIGDLLEFAPGDTPRCVEKPGTVSLPRAEGLRMLGTVYHFEPALGYDANWRVEFSVHPLRRGFRHDHTIIWEMEDVGASSYAADVRWPNLFSRFVGDKAFGLLVADVLGLPVPRTTVFARNLAPFAFGAPTASGEFWIRTCPTEQDPGRFTTRRGWLDPFKLMRDEDPEGTRIASVLAQEGVDAQHSGSLVTSHDGEVTVEGVRGYGDDFMVGRAGRESLPPEVREAVVALYERASARLGAVRFEWAYDGRAAWVVQLHRGATDSSGNTVYPGEVASFRRFEVARGIDALRALISEVQGTGEGIEVVGNVGITSHFGDLLRRARVPSRIVPPGGD
jgi:hypothetical protein